VNLARDTTFDEQGRGLTASWMDALYDWSNPTFKNRVGESLNLAVNCVTDVLHTLYLQSQRGDSTPPIFAFPPGTLPLWTIGATILAIALVITFFLSRTRPKQPKGKLVRLS